MDLTIHRARDLIALLDAVRRIFPNDATYSWNPDFACNFIVSWPMHHQPPELTQIAREISIRISEDALHAYVRLPEEDKPRAHEMIRAHVWRRLAPYSEGHDNPRGTTPPPFTIEYPGAPT